MNQNPLLQHARLLFEQNRAEAAETKLRQLLVSDPQNSDAVALLVLCLLQREQYDEATERAKEAIALSPDTAYFHAVLGQIWLKRNYLQRAEQPLQQAIALDPYHPWFRVILAQLRYRQSRFEEALAAVEGALELNPEDDSATALRGEILRRMGRSLPAAAALEETLARDPENAYSHAIMGWTKLQQGDRKQALTYFREALRLEPELEMAREGMLDALRAANPFYRAVLQFTFWINRWPPRVRWGILLGGFFGVQILANLAEQQPAWAPYLWVLIFAYIAFAFSTWFATPLTNVLLLFHPLGRHALTRIDRWAAVGTGLACVATLVAAGLALAKPESEHRFLVALFTFSATITVASSLPIPPSRARNIMLIYLVIIVSLTVAFASLTLFERLIPLAQVPTIVSAYISLMRWNTLISTLAPQLLVSIPERH